jgi:hypothetical protein
MRRAWVELRRKSSEPLAETRLLGFRKHETLDNYELTGFLPQRVSPVHSLLIPPHELKLHSSISVRDNQSINQSKDVNLFNLLLALNKAIK